MPEFKWEARTNQGSVVKGVLEAPNNEAVMAQLRAEKLTPIKVKKKPKDIELAFLAPKVKINDLVIFTRQFATMIDAGMPLVQCLDILGGQCENPTFKKVIKEVKNDVESGKTFAESLAKHPKVFDPLYTNLVSAGEIGGILDGILNRLAVYLEKAEKLRRQLKGAMTYPITVISIACVVVGFLLVKVIPVFEKMFADFGGELPMPTQVVVMISNFLQEWLVVALVALFLFVTVFKMAREKIPNFHYMTDAAMLRLPVFGDIIRKVAVARFTRTMGTMLSSGVPILDGLDIVARTSGNDVIERSLQKVRTAISEGKNMAEPLAESGVFPGMVCQMIAVGEATGAMDTMLQKIADFYEDEVDVAVGALSSMIEPLLMVFLGGTVGGIMIAMYLPIFKIAETVG
jgi:type IV pilus assembly protein PilC